MKKELKIKQRAALLWGVMYPTYNSKALLPIYKLCIVRLHLVPSYREQMLQKMYMIFVILHSRTSLSKVDDVKILDISDDFFYIIESILFGSVLI